MHPARVPPTAKTEIRAARLRETILRYLECTFRGSYHTDLLNHKNTAPAAGGYDKVNIVGHSMGGLDARYLVSQLDGHQYVERFVRFLAHLAHESDRL